MQVFHQAKIATSLSIFDRNVFKDFSGTGPRPYPWKAGICKCLAGACANTVNANDEEGRPQWRETLLCSTTDQFSIFKA